MPSKHEMFAVRALSLTRAHFSAIVGHARACAPAECCGLLGGDELTGNVKTAYRLSNIATHPLTRYEAAPEDLFAAQRAMRAGGEVLLAIYHSHPRAHDTVPSPSDVALAYYPSAAYLIVALAGDEPKVGAFRIDERHKSWQHIELFVTD